MIGAVSRSVQKAVFVKEVEVDSLPRNLNLFARQNGGHFVEIVN